MRSRHAARCFVFSLAVALAACGGSPERLRGGESTIPAGGPQIGWATYYAARLAGRTTANGERYDPSAMTAAHRTLPFGTTVQVRRTDGRSVVVRINDRGPYVTGRIVDLSHRAAEKLGMLREGKVWVELWVLLSAELSADR